MNGVHEGLKDDESVSTLARCSLMVSVPTADLQASASWSAETVSQLLYGEAVDVLDADEPWLKVRGRLDGYEGWANRAHFSDDVRPSTHRVTNRSTLLFSEASIKSRIYMRLSFGARITLLPDIDDDGDFVRTTTGEFVWKAHCQPVDLMLTDDPADIVRQHFLSAPYRWGGRSADGLDCSGLVQLVASMAGVDLPRDSKEQEMALEKVERHSEVRANDLVFWPGHVAWMVDSHTVIHANAASLNVRQEPLVQVNQRAGQPSSFRRFPKPSGALS